MPMIPLVVLLTLDTRQLQAVANPGFVDDLSIFVEESIAERRCEIDDSRSTSAHD